MLDIDGLGTRGEHFVSDRLAHFPRGVLHFLRAHVRLAPDDIGAIVQPAVTELGGRQHIRAFRCALIVHWILIEETAQTVHFRHVFRRDANLYIAIRVEAYPKALQMRHENDRIAHLRHDERFHFAVR